MNHLSKISGEMQKLHEAGVTGPYVATMSPTTKAELNERLRSVRYDQLEPPVPFLMTKLETRYGEVTFAIDPALDPNEIVLVQQTVKDQP